MEKDKEGYGDRVEKVLDKTGIKKVVERVMPKGCGCGKRKRWLNKL